MNISDDRKGTLAILSTGILWSSIGVFVAELAACGSTPSLTAFMRMAFGFMFVFPVALMKNSVRVDKKTLFACAVLGLLAHAPFNICYGLSVPANGVALAAVLLYSAPVFTALASRILFGEKFSFRKILALILNIIGCILAVTGGNFFDADITFSGILFGVGAGFFYGMIPILGKIAGQHANPFTVSTWSYFFTSVALLIFTRPPVMLLKNFNLTTLGIFYGLITAALPYVIYYYGVQKIKETSRVPVFASIELVIASVIGIVIYNELIKTINIIGIILVLSSIILDSSEGSK